jgi:hypothetical protein
MNQFHTEYNTCIILLLLCMASLEDIVALEAWRVEEHIIIFR